jgi:hypothetical protein
MHLLPATAEALEALREATLLEEERLPPAMVCEWVSSMSAGGVVRVITVVVPLSKLCVVSAMPAALAVCGLTLIAQNFIRFVQGGHLFFGPSNIWVHSLCLGTASDQS